LLAGGPDVQIVFGFAHALQQLGRRDEAVELYRQPAEMAPAFVDAWNNLGVLLAEMERMEGSVQVITVRPVQLSYTAWGTNPAA
jgi:Flp pilus assembly protein TadD